MPLATKRNRILSEWESLMQDWSRTVARCCFAVTKGPLLLVRLASFSAVPGRLRVTQGRESGTLGVTTVAGSNHKQICTRKRIVHGFCPPFPSATLSVLLLWAVGHAPLGVPRKSLHRSGAKTKWSRGGFDDDFRSPFFSHDKQPLPPCNQRSFCVVFVSSVSAMRIAVLWQRRATRSRMEQR